LGIFTRCPAVDACSDETRGQVLLGHTRLETTTIYTKVATKTIRDVTSPLDLLVSREAGSG